MKVILFHEFGQFVSTVKNRADAVAGTVIMCHLSPDTSNPDAHLTNEIASVFEVVMDNQLLATSLLCGDRHENSDIELIHAHNRNIEKATELTGLPVASGRVTQFSEYDTGKFFF
jgi:hypothetical protein